MYTIPTKFAIYLTSIIHLYSLGMVENIAKICFWQLTDVCFGGMFINLSESLLKGKPVYTLIFIHICNAMLTALTGSLV
ncbi:hypothetical protein V7075_13595 [Neobacillus drentensis]|uniref:hypothetical protein n=1 Tax=Neobacillus drentensis TaxID=220684 RepID=UPI002FFD8CA0